MKRFILPLLLSMAVLGLAFTVQANLFIPTAGETQILNILLRSTAEESLTIKLYTDAGNFAAADVAGTRTELSGGGYSSKTLAAGSGNWSISAGQPTIATWSGTAVTWTFTGAASQINGYYVIGATSGTIYWEEPLLGNSLGTSSSTNTIASSGSLTFTTSTSLGLSGGSVQIVNANNLSQWIIGTVTSDTGTSLVITATACSSAGTSSSSWIVYQARPFTPANSGDTLTITPKFQLQ